MRPHSSEGGGPWLPKYRKKRRPFWSVATFSALILLLLALFVNW